MINQLKINKSTPRQPSQLSDEDQREISELLRVFNSSMGKNFRNRFKNFKIYFWQYEIDQIPNLESPKFFRCYQNIKTVKKQQKDMFTVKEQMRHDGESSYLKSKMNRK